MDNAATMPAYVVDDDPDLRSSLVELLEALGHPARAFANAAGLLGALDGLAPGLLLIDIRLGEEDGLDVLRALAGRSCYWPAAIITAHGDIPLAVEAVRIGAFEFVEKPFVTARLREVLAKGAELLPAAVERTDRVREARTVIATLSQRQREVLNGIVAGLTSKEIAQQLGLSHRTVESYRLDMMNKLRVQNVAELFRLASTADGSDGAA